jgi:hypothetical protein
MARVQTIDVMNAVKQKHADARRRSRKSSLIKEAIEKSSEVC